MAGYGSSPYGGGPYGGSLFGSTEYESFDLFCFFHCSSMFNILSDPSISTLGNGLHFDPNVVTCDLDLKSGTGAPVPTENGVLIVTSTVPNTWTLEWTGIFYNLPNDFTDLVDRHFFVGSTNASGPCAGLFVSKIGLMYAGGIHHDGGNNLIVDSTTQIIPGSAAYITEGEYITIRMSVSGLTGAVYVFVTKAVDVLVSGQVLRAVLPVIDAAALAFPPTDRTVVSFRGDVPQPTYAGLDQLCLSSSVLIPNLKPVADAGADQAANVCSVIKLDGSASFDPEGAPLIYQWRLIDAPIGSEFALEGGDGFTQSDPSGFVDRFFSNDPLGVVDPLDPILAGDVLLLDGTAHTIVGTGIDGVPPSGGFYVQIGSAILPELLTNAQFKVLRQRGISGPTTVSPTFYPDLPSFYSFDLVVNDGALYSSPSLTIINVLESPLPRGCIPDLTFMFNYLSDFWNLVEDRDRIAVFWSSLAQIAATELFTLWQYEYSKSHRDIQRVFVRRWLHYDLLLAEPLPELTNVRAIFGGVTSSFPAGGAISGTSLVISSPVLSEDVTIDITAANPVSEDILVSAIQSRLRSVDDRFTVVTITDRVSADVGVRIYAPFPFTIASGTTLPSFAVGAEGRPPAGTGGAGVGQRTYKVPISLEGLDIEEDDFLVLEGFAYRISSLLDDPADQFAYQRVVVKSNLPAAPSNAWAISGWVSSELLDFYNGLVTLGDHIDFEVSDTSIDIAPASARRDIIETTVLGVNDALPSRAAVDFWPLGGELADDSLRVMLARVLRRTYVPCNEYVSDVPTLQEKIVIEDDEGTLRRNVDYFLEEVRDGYGIRFQSGQSGDAGDVWEGERPPNRLWAEYTYLDNRPLIEANFGLAVDLTVDQLDDLPADVDYLSAVRGLWYAFYNGPTIRNLRIGSQILLGLPFAETAGTITEIRSDFSPSEGRILIQDAENEQIIRSYNFPASLELEVNPATGERYVVGDTVEEFAPLVEGTEVIDYITDPTWFQGILNQGIFYEVEKFHKFVVRIDVAAFNLSALLFVRNFILKIKPTYTFPIFLVLQEVGDTEVSVTDDVELTGTLRIFDLPCNGSLGMATMYDQPRPGGGGWRNQFDADNDPDNPLPIWTGLPSAAESVGWAWDKQYSCPEDVTVLQKSILLSVPTLVTFDTVLAFDTHIKEKHEWQSNVAGFPPVPPAGFNITLTKGGTASFDGTLIQLRFFATGTPGSSADWQVVIQTNSGGPWANVAVETFTSVVNTEIVSTLSVSISAGDQLRAIVRPASGTQSHNWRLIKCQVIQENAALWHFGDTVPAGSYVWEGIV